MWAVCSQQILACCHLQNLCYLFVYMRHVSSWSILQSLFFSVVPGVFVFSPKSTNVTVMFPSGTGVEVRAGEGVMTLTVLLPHVLHNHTQGLLGTMNDDPEDEFTSSNGLIIPSNSSAQDIFSYCAGCE